MKAKVVTDAMLHAAVKDELSSVLGAHYGYRLASQLWDALEGMEPNLGDPYQRAVCALAELKAATHELDLANPDGTRYSIGEVLAHHFTMAERLVGLWKVTQAAQLAEYSARPAKIEVRPLPSVATLRQLLADKLGVPIERVEVKHHATEPWNVDVLVVTEVGHPQDPLAVRQALEDLGCIPLGMHVHEVSTKEAW